jgi:hypothetical protein
MCARAAARRPPGHAHEQAALAARGHGHVAADEEGEPTEHRFLRHVRLAREEHTDAGGELLVVGHRRDSGTIGRVAESFEVKLANGEVETADSLWGARHALARRAAFAARRDPQPALTVAQ